MLFGDEVITIFDGIIPERTQYFVFMVSRVIIPIYGLLFPILLLSVVIAIVSVAAEQKVHIITIISKACRGLTLVCMDLYSIDLTTMNIYSHSSLSVSFGELALPMTVTIGIQGNIFYNI